MIMQMNYQNNANGGPSKLRFKKNSSELEEIHMVPSTYGIGMANSGATYNK
jgi:hypothetical protein